jgi:transcriptional regulator with XRE-family HTH domain
MNEDFTKLIRDVRLKAGLTQAQLASELGVSQPTVSGLESGRLMATPRMQVRVKRFTEKLKSPTASSQVVLFDFPKREESKRVDSFRFESWQDSEASGDFANAYPLPGKAVLFVCIDMAGHGAGAVPSRTFVEGWLAGYLANATSTPRVENIAEKLSVALNEADFQLSGFFAVITPTTALAARYEAACFSMPLPLLLMGPPYEPRPAAELSPALPADASEIKVTRIESLPAPWKIIAGSDGLYQRLGTGDEDEGRLRIRKWFTGDEAAQPLQELLKSDALSMDDEVCAVIDFSPWRISTNTSSKNYTERQVAFGMIRQLIGDGVDQDRRERFMQAVMEAMNNSAGHAYPGQEEGSLTIRFRDEPDGWRVEVLDTGIGFAPRSTHGGGLKVIETNTSHHFIQPNRGGGTRVTLLLDAKPKPNT